MNQKVKEYIDKQKCSDKEILLKLRDLLYKEIPEIEEDFMYGVPMYDGGLFYLAALKKQVNFGFTIVGLSDEEIKLFEGTGETARHIKVYEYDKETEEKLIPLIRLVKEKARLPH